ncbi:hypothetical protein LPB67_12795 [Undibacterium sp. Jales W-56]|uniref:hypothetical protein n=1 Tax=Undibacterium sp. Jales W-56 TaxID=2897325 RepID=UPI0021D021A4|nr:hypothetical protein [Undibacterium sp. Jales W-56]MCU6434649.1 hypothetical protein [Undibacterium sp. Jales W-56]
MSENPEKSEPPIPLTITVPQMIETAGQIIAAFQKNQAESIEAIREHNNVQAKLWGRALWAEAIFVATVIFSGLGFAAYLACINQIGTAEKIAFAVFGFIGGRGFLHIRGLMDSRSKK